MTPATMPQAVRMRPVASPTDSAAASEILMLFVGDEPWKLDSLVPCGKSFEAVELAEDGSAAVFDVYAESAWDTEVARTPLSRIIVRR